MKDELDEIWKPIPGYDGAYEASSHGSIRSVPRLVSNGRGDYVHHMSGRIMKARQNAQGYFRVSTRLDGRSKSEFVHRLVARAFLGLPDEALECAHLDGTKNNNRPNNLSWVTREENQGHRIVHGTHSRGERSYHSRLTNEEVGRLRERRSLGASVKDLAQEVGYNPATMSRLLRGVTWTSV